jgi:hypothetical protein
VVSESLLSRRKTISTKARLRLAYFVLPLLLHKVAGSERTQYRVLVWHAGRVGDKGQRIFALRDFVSMAKKPCHETMSHIIQLQHRLHDLRNTEHDDHLTSKAGSLLRSDHGMRLVYPDFHAVPLEQRTADLRASLPSRCPRNACFDWLDLSSHFLVPR